MDVNAAAQLLEDTKTDVSQVVGTRDIMELPINGRRVDSFVLNTPGVTNDATFGLLTFRGVAGNNSFLLDGNDNTEQFYDENAGRTRIQSQISADAVQEFEVVSTNFSAEYGRAMGGVVNTVTKSGTNDIHGSAFYFLRSTGFDAHDPYSAFNPTEHRIQTGGTVGGAIIKNKLFYFLSDDITRRNFPFVDSQVKVGFVNPSTEAVGGLHARRAGAVQRDQRAAAALLRSDSAHGARTICTSAGSTIISTTRTPSAPASISCAGCRRTASRPVFPPPPARESPATATTPWRCATGRPPGPPCPTAMVNSFRYGLDTDRQADGFDQAELGGGLGYLDVAVAGVQLGPATYLPRVEPLEIRNEFADDVSWAKGKHMIKFGFTFEHVTDDVNYLSNRYGSYTYPTVTSFALGLHRQHHRRPRLLGVHADVRQSVVDYAIKDIGFYLQDQWKVTDRLTVTLGARYEYTFMPPPAQTNPLFPLTGESLPSGTRDLAPRIGLAYRVNEKTVIRAGVGTFFARLVSGILDDVYTGNGIYQVSDSLSNATLIAQGPTFPECPGRSADHHHAGRFHAGRPVAEPEDAVFRTGDHRGGAADRQGHGASPSPESSAAESICGARRISTLPRSARRSPTPSTTPRDSRSAPTRRGFTRERGRIRISARSTSRPTASAVGTTGWSLAFDKRFSHGFQSSASYTWSHEIDDGQGAATNAHLRIQRLAVDLQRQLRLRQRQRLARPAAALRLLVRVGAGVHCIRPALSPSTW